VEEGGVSGFLVVRPGVHRHIYYIGCVRGVPQWTTTYPPRPVRDRVRMSRSMADTVVKHLKILGVDDVAVVEA
jgi:hypothetical protein